VRMEKALAVIIIIADGARPNRTRTIKVSGNNAARRC